MAVQEHPGKISEAVSDVYIWYILFARFAVTTHCDAPDARSHERASGASPGMPDRGLKGAKAPSQVSKVSRQAITLGNLQSTDKTYEVCL